MIMLIIIIGLLIWALISLAVDFIAGTLNRETVSKAILICLLSGLVSVGVSFNNDAGEIMAKSKDLTFIAIYIDNAKLGYKFTTTKRSFKHNKILKRLISLNRTIFFDCFIPDEITSYNEITFGATYQ